MKNLAKVFSLICFSLCFLTASAFAAAPESEKAGTEKSSPSKYVEEVVTDVQETINKNKDKLSETQLDEQLKLIIKPAFDFEEMAKRSLGANWSEATADEQKEFVDLFSALLSRTYLKRIREAAGDAGVQVVKERVKGKLGIVRTKVKSGDNDVSIDYRLQHNGKQWAVYDVIIENVGLVSNYRSEFAGIVRNEKMAGLLERLRNKD